MSIPYPAALVLGPGHSFHPQMPQSQPLSMDDILISSPTSSSFSTSPSSAGLVKTPTSAGGNGNSTFALAQQQGPPQTTEGYYFGNEMIKEENIDKGLGIGGHHPFGSNGEEFIFSHPPHSQPPPSSFPSVSTTDKRNDLTYQTNPGNPNPFPANASPHPTSIRPGSNLTLPPSVLRHNTFPMNGDLHPPLSAPSTSTTFPPSVTAPPAAPRRTVSSSNLASAVKQEGENQNLQPPLLASTAKVGMGAGAFVFKVYNMLMDDSSQHLISFSQTGTSFIVNNVKEFSSDVLPKHFKHNNFSSFVRQLNMYGFHKVNKTPRGQKGSTDNQQWEFNHPKFIKGRADLLDSIRRKALEQEPPRARSSYPSPAASYQALRPVPISVQVASAQEAHILAAQQQHAIQQQQQAHIQAQYHQQVAAQQAALRAQQQAQVQASLASLPSPPFESIPGQPADVMERLNSFRHGYEVMHREMIEMRRKQDILVELCGHLYKSLEQVNGSPLPFTFPSLLLQHGIGYPASTSSASAPNIFVTAHDTHGQPTSSPSVPQTTYYPAVAPAQPFPGTQQPTRSNSGDSHLSSSQSSDNTLSHSQSPESVALTQQARALAIDPAVSSSHLHPGHVQSPGNPESGFQLAMTTPLPPSPNPPQPGALNGDVQGGILGSGVQNDEPMSYSYNPTDAMGFGESMFKFENAFDPNLSVTTGPPTMGLHMFNYFGSENEEGQKTTAVSVNVGA